VLLPSAWQWQSTTLLHNSHDTNHSC
jgi:hypothetical protein